MILVETSVWVDHLRRTDALLAQSLERCEVLIHPFVIGEIACGTLANRAQTLALLCQLPLAPVAEADEALGFIELRKLHGRGVGYVDVHLLASTALSAGSRLWTRDKRLHALAASLGCAYDETSASG